MLDHSRLNIPNDAVPFRAKNSTAISSTTAQEIAAAPGAGKTRWITQLVFSNPTATEVAEITIQDDAGTPDELVTVTLEPQKPYEIKFDPPLKMATNQALDGVAQGSVGDTTVTAVGYVGTAPASDKVTDVAR